MPPPSMSTPTTAPTPERPVLTPPPLPEEAGSEADAADPVSPSPSPTADRNPPRSLLPADDVAEYALELFGARNLAGKYTSTKWRATTATGGSFRSRPASSQLDTCGARAHKRSCLWRELHTWMFAHQRVKTHHEYRAVGRMVRWTHRSGRSGEGRGVLKGAIFELALDFRARTKQLFSLSTSRGEQQFRSS